MSQEDQPGGPFDVPETNWEKMLLRPPWLDYSLLGSVVLHHGPAAPPPSPEPGQTETEETTSTTDQEQSDLVSEKKIVDDEQPGSYKATETASMIVKDQLDSNKTAGTTCFIVDNQPNSCEETGTACTTVSDQPDASKAAETCCTTFDDQPNFHVTVETACTTVNEQPDLHGTLETLCSIVYLPEAAEIACTIVEDQLYSCVVETAIAAVVDQPNFCAIVEDLPDYREAAKFAINRSELRNILKPYMLFSFYRQVRPVIQQGPQCGLVALNMATQLLSSYQPSVQTIFESAAELEFTKFGEMFSVENMGILARKLLHCEVEVVKDMEKNRRKILGHLLRGNPVLLPYDADRNHEPYCNKGYSAHWAVLTGVVLMNVNLPYALLNQQWKFENNLCHFDSGDELLKLLDVAEDVYVYAYQGKSKHVAAWSYRTLMYSNQCLVDRNPKCKELGMILPSNPDALRDKAVLLSL